MATKKNNKKTAPKKAGSKSKKNTKKNTQSKVYQVRDVINEPLPFSNTTQDNNETLNNSVVEQPAQVYLEPKPADIYEKLPEEEYNNTYKNHMLPTTNRLGDYIFVFVGIVVVIGLLALLAL
jgi:hypothetical protein